MSRFSSQMLLSAYRQAIQLDHPYHKEYAQYLTPDEHEQLLEELIHWLVHKEQIKLPQDMPGECCSKRNFLRALLNVRAPQPLDELILAKLNRLQQAEALYKDIAKADKLQPITATLPGVQWPQGERCVLWQGDITALEIDAIVNAANAELLGCFWPLHACIDNAIHLAAGPQLRADCKKIMRMQQSREKTGHAKITRAYNLPAKFVLHTVGPVVPQGTMPQRRQEEELASCYASCLSLANEVANIKSIAFCAISTGVFGFPKKEAAGIAVNTVKKWLCAYPGRFAIIMFCVFGKEDYHAYASALCERG